MMQKILTWDANISSVCGLLKTGLAPTICEISGPLG